MLHESEDITNAELLSIITQQNETNVKQFKLMDDRFELMDNRFKLMDNRFRLLDERIEDRYIKLQTNMNNHYYKMFATTTGSLLVFLSIILAIFKLVD